jgi:ElaB/YqjD/DUF883 family membrane-anchored ribosome-binding protein
MNLAEAHKKIRQLEDFIEELRKHHHEVLGDYAERQENLIARIKAVQSELLKKDQKILEQHEKIVELSRERGKYA